MQYNDGSDDINDNITKEDDNDNDIVDNDNADDSNDSKADKMTILPTLL